MSTVTDPTLPRPYSPDPADRVAAEMAAAWRRGERLPAEAWLARHPELLDRPEEAVRLVYEEVCLRQERGEDVAAEELSRRFPGWSAELAVLLDCHRLIECGTLAPAFPAVGQSLGDFRLVAELGRGAQGRVYLATQHALADRPVVLKVTAHRAHEHLSLARLQHTHIIPLHAIYEFPERKLRVLCMPFLGGATLAHVFDALAGQPVSRRTGRSLLDALDAAAGAAPVRLPGRGGYRQNVAAASYVDAVCLVAACLADGLRHAHERGLVHLDLKPSNVLLAADAQPLLLDFHLAVHPVRAGQSLPEWFGGTPGYMPPEQAAACAAARRGQPAGADVDARSDVYALGRLMYVALAGGEPAAEPLPPLCGVNPCVSTGLSDIVRKCLAPAPGERYPDAASLADDLRRHLASQPLRGVRNRDLRERWRRWRRRRPNAGLWLALLLALGAGGAIMAGAALERYRDARSADDGEGQLRRRVARRAKAAQELHAVAERLRFLAGAEAPPAADREALRQRSRTLLENRALLTDATSPLDPSTEEQVREDLRDLVMLSPESADGMGPTKEAPPAPQTAWEHVARGRFLLRSGELDQAVEELRRAADLRPQDFWAHFYLGVCAYRRGGPAEAVHSFGVALALAPSSPECYTNRGLAYMAWGKKEQARADYDRALALDPGAATARLNRGVLSYQEGRLAEAAADLERALRDGADPATGYYDLALVRLAARDEAAARRDLDRALAADPGHAEARALRERLSPGK
jgi:serine/threonine protein kinase/Flp pilus assembly protein TadD